MATYDWDRIRGNHPAACTCIACDEERRPKRAPNALKGDSEIIPPENALTPALRKMLQRRQRPAADADRVGDGF